MRVFKPSVIEQHVDAIMGLEDVAQDNTENATVWKAWRAIRTGSDHHAEP
jgi:hypothetical protein